jgi:sulfur carrier protein
MEQMTLEINGELRSLPPVSNLRDLLVQLGIGEDRIAVEVNRRIIRRRDWELFRLNDRDRIEIVQFVGGG